MEIASTLMANGIHANASSYHSEKLNGLLHTSQENGLSPLCMRWCFFKVSITLDDLLHTLHENGRSPVCMRFCVFIFPLMLDDLLHTLHENWRSPLCMPWCFFRSLLLMNDLLHTFHAFGRSALNDLMCIQSTPLTEWLITQITRKRAISSM
jgi:hypothetical protein